VTNSTTNLVLSPDSPIDLQLHTIFSDGTWAPEQLMDHLIEQQFALAAITDHDRVDIITFLQELAIQKDFPLLIATEMSTLWRGQPTDVLCYGFAFDDSPLRDAALDITRRQRDNTREVYHKLIAQGCKFSDGPEELTALLDLPSAQHPHALVALMKQYGYGSPEASAGRMVLDAGCEFATTDIVEVVDVTHRSGGVCLIAHPGRGGEYVSFDVSLLDQLREEAPIDGFEVYYPAHSPEQVTMYEDYARQHNLLTSSGSDSHAPDKPPIKYRAELSRPLLERLGIQIS
jgi:3',5'-nucleoside bisphosphate phosphatase